MAVSLLLFFRLSCPGVGMSSPSLIPSSSPVDCESISFFSFVDSFLPQGLTVCRSSSAQAVVTGSFTLSCFFRSPSPTAGESVFPLSFSTFFSSLVSSFPHGGHPSLSCVSFLRLILLSPRGWSVCRSSGQTTSCSRPSSPDFQTLFCSSTSRNPSPLFHRHFHKIRISSKCSDR